MTEPLIFFIVPAAAGGLQKILLIQGGAAALMLFGLIGAFINVRKKPEVKSLKIPLFVLPLALAGILTAMYTIHKQANATVEILPGALAIHAGLYSQTIPLSDLDSSHAQIVNLNERKDLHETGRINGTCAMGSLLAGWFRLSNGHKAYLTVTDWSSVVYLPAKNFDILLSLQDAPGFIRTLKQAR